jgi:hypothetical protein
VARGKFRRRTHFAYSTNSGHLASYLRGLVTLVEVFDALQNTSDADDVLIAKTSYVYDNYASMGGIEDYGGAIPPGYFSNLLIGNVTGTTQWVDIAAGTVIQHLAKYDKFGNVVKAQLSCCQEKDLTTTEDTLWSQPESEMSGDPNGVHQTTSTDYDFNTSLPTSQTDPAGLETNIGYNAALQPSSFTLPTGATSQRNVDYASLSSTSTQTYDDGGVSKTITNTAQYDGWGRVIQTIAPNNAQVNTAYDNMGRG